MAVVAVEGAPMPTRAAEPSSVKVEVAAEPPGSPESSKRAAPSAGCPSDVPARKRVAPDAASPSDVTESTEAVKDNNKDPNA